MAKARKGVTKRRLNSEPQRDDRENNQSQTAKRKKHNSDDGRCFAATTWRANLDTMPTEVLLRIFSFCLEADLASTCKRISSQLPPFPALAHQMMLLAFTSESYWPDDVADEYERAFNVGVPLPESDRKELQSHIITKPWCTAARFMGILRYTVDFQMQRTLYQKNREWHKYTRSETLKLKRFWKHGWKRLNYKFHAVGKDDRGETTVFSIASKAGIGFSGDSFRALALDQWIPYVLLKSPLSDEKLGLVSLLVQTLFRPAHMQPTGLRVPENLIEQATEEAIMAGRKDWLFIIKALGWAKAVKLSCEGWYRESLAPVQRAHGLDLERCGSQPTYHMKLRNGRCLPFAWKPGKSQSLL